ncbi:hypothetical protein EGJ27_21520 [Pseudomonas sp. v388]|nr:hypothetical protein EGJ27_21520 [Pseudomonas sp. v388]
MHQTGFTYNDEERLVLERVRDSQRFSDLDQAAEWLIRTRLRRVAVKLCGRSRALYSANYKPQGSR